MVSKNTQLTYISIQKSPHEPRRHSSIEIGCKSEGQRADRGAQQPKEDGGSPTQSVRYHTPQDVTN